MASEYYWKDKCASRNRIMSAVLVWLFLVAVFLVVDAASYYMTVNRLMAISPEANRHTERELPSR